MWDPLLMNKHPFSQKLWVQLTSHQSAAPAANQKSADYIPSYSAPQRNILHPGSGLGGQACGEIRSAGRNEAILMTCNYGKPILPAFLTSPGPLKLQRILANI